MAAHTQGLTFDVMTCVNRENLKELPKILDLLEYQRVMDYAVEKVNGRVPVIIGTGSNDTAKAIEKTKAACAAGADAVLLVTPYYNKTTQRGLAAHYQKYLKPIL